MNSEGRKWERHEKHQRKNSDTFYFVLTTGEKEKAFPQYHDWDGHLPQGKTTNHQLGVMLMEETKSKIIQLLRGKFRSWQPIGDGAKHLFFCSVGGSAWLQVYIRCACSALSPPLNTGGHPELWESTHIHELAHPKILYIYTIHVENQTSYYHISLLYILYHIMFTISSLVRITIWCHQIPPWVKPAKITVGRPPVSAFLAASAVGAMVGFLKKTSKDGFGRKRWESWENVGNSWKKLDTFEHVLMLLSFNGRGHGKI